MLGLWCRSRKEGLDLPPPPPTKVTIVQKNEITIGNIYVFFTRFGCFGGGGMGGF